MKYFSFIPLAIYNEGGLALAADVSLEYEKHIFTLSTSTGSEVSVLGNNNSSKQLNVMYGRELMLNITLFIVAHLGLGYFTFKSNGVSEERSFFILVFL